MLVLLSVLPAWGPAPEPGPSWLPHVLLLVPRYYDPELDAALAALEPTHSLPAGDILHEQDGTHLTGTSAFVTEMGLLTLFQSHINRLRVLKPDVIDPWMLFACLQVPIVKRQIRAKQFTQDIIDTRCSVKHCWLWIVIPLTPFMGRERVQVSLLPVGRRAHRAALRPVLFSCRCSRPSPRLDLLGACTSRVLSVC